MVRPRRGNTRPAAAARRTVEDDKENETVGVIASRSSGHVAFKGDAQQLIFIEDVSHHTDKLTG